MTTPSPLAGRRVAIFAWCLYDLAITAFGAVIATFIFAVYFTRSVAESEVAGTAAWSQAVSLAGLVVAVLSPVLGAIADRAGRRKPWIAVLTALGVVASLMMWFVTPTPSSALLATAMLALGTIGFELAVVFYNAMLPRLAPVGWIGRLSGWGWAFGYLGGMGCLVLALFGLVQTETPLFGLIDTVDAANVRATGPLVAVWCVLFALPLFVWTPDEPATGATLGRAVREGLGTLWQTVREIRRYRNIVRFLIASALYRDGLITLVTFGGIYAAGTFGMDFGEIVIFAIALNVSAAIGSIAFAWVDDWIGAKPTIEITLIGLIALGIPTLLITEALWFWVLAIGLGLFIGPAQAAGRSLMARLCPAGMETEMFGLYNLAGKAVAFLGPLVLGWATETFASQRVGMGTILLFFLAGYLLMLTVREPSAGRPTAAAATESGQ